uniref:Predicted protein n=1 Tax=Hordeum vulgare subsp. vulgare TaxID=112509 RepID=F2EDD5_HORVV|nr:predicted protein [Hordeum vulgare subsp. vulgare]
MREQEMVKGNLVTFLRARTLPSQNACRLKLIAWVHAFDQYLRYWSSSVCWPLGPYICKT